ncbi:thiol:disulfide interchange protein precursor [bacterium BMS3Abin07]|nr:thiol:disulfide interchange protein precursor [bacterium BMS3Abin07]GBE32560.1 thiol:disulfide interchange protein precursor [bacterium BMS3Bbin05]HDO22543.1 cytochrome c biogenesis protein CcdA [Nitrospirota bacterium]HDZ89018.1 cytochrome c biogenesis protein CcdA [Nitrospirota bacterium]
MKDVSYSISFLAGVISFLSPCVLPLLPSYVSFITGISFEDLTGKTDRARIRFLTLTNSLAFIFGFSAVFISLGASSSAIGRFLFNYQDTIRIAGGIIIIIFGLFVAGFVNIGLFSKEKKFHLAGKPSGYVGAFVIGMTFAAGWTPCIGPILGSILLYASTKGSALYGIKLLAVYSLGLAIPFLIASLAINTFLSHSKKIQRYMRVIMIISGLLMVIFGIMLLTNQVSQLTRFFPDFGINL